MNKKTVKDVDVSGKRVLMRADFNVPLDKKTGAISDDTRIEAALPTIKYLLDHNAKLILMSHLGRPKGVDEKLRLDPVAQRLTELLNKPVVKLQDVTGSFVEQAVAGMQPGDIILLENVRFPAKMSLDDPKFKSDDEKNDPELAQQLAKLADVFVNDAFGTAHRAHSSTEGVTHYMSVSVAGLLLEKELNVMSAALTSPDRPLVAVMGGAKVSDKIGVIENLLSVVKVDNLLIGGGMANTFFKAQGFDMADSLVEDDKLEVARDLLHREDGTKIILPVDVTIADAFSAEANAQTVKPDAVPAGWRILDIGPETVAKFAKYLAGAKTALFNGTMGVAEFPQFAKGTDGVVEALAKVDGTTIIGGGESVEAVQKSGLADKMTHISTGGGASLEFLEGKTLPGVAALSDK